ncbi:hypothetical protein CTI12_AA066990 [Artemisia annua]|uniref:Uncharacterized protein n=1 Tax=Artemisia annua TaxID=35608 RepID=A0A2U1NQA1_ARTAN|nr:hypothetical protein CTI12_AA066990 [Artemisia annua]
MEHKRIGSTILLDEPFEWSNDISLEVFANAIDEDEEDDTARSTRKSKLTATSDTSGMPRWQSYDAIISQSWKSKESKGPEAYTPTLPRLVVLGDENIDIDLPIGEHIDTLSMGDREIDFEDIESLPANDPVPNPRMSDEPLGNSDSMSRSFDVTISNPLFDFDDNFTLRIDNKIFDDEFEDLCSLDPP